MTTQEKRKALERVPCVAKKKNTTNSTGTIHGSLLVSA